MQSSLKVSYITITKKIPEHTFAWHTIPRQEYMHIHLFDVIELFSLPFDKELSLLNFAQSLVFL